MFTFHHGLWIYFLTRRHTQVWQFLIGSMLPDYIYFVLLLMALIKDHIKPDDVISLNPYTVMGIMPMYPWIVKADLLGHSVVIWGAAFLLVLMPVLNRWQPFVVGWGSHLFIDGLTHGAYANYFLYPFSMYAVHSPVSYWEPEYFAREFKMVNNTLLAMIIIYLVYQWWQKKQLK